MRFTIYICFRQNLQIVLNKHLYVSCNTYNNNKILLYLNTGSPVTLSLQNNGEDYVVIQTFPPPQSK